MVTLQEIQTLKTKLSGVRDKTVQAQTLYDSTMARIVESLNKLAKMLYEISPDTQPTEFLASFSPEVFSLSENLNENGYCDVEKILDVDALSKVTEYVNNILSKMDADIQSEYDDISNQVEEWQKIIRGEQNAST